MPHDQSAVAFLCSLDGVILRILRDDLQLPPCFSPGATFADMVEEPSAERAREFCTAVRQRGAVFDCALTVSVAAQPTALHFAGVVQGDHLLVMAARSADALTDADDGLVLINHEQTKALRSAFKELSLHARRQTVPDRHLYDDLSRLNNELANLQREMARKNAELGKLNEQKNRFLGMAAHDLRNPLGIIYTLSEFIEADAENLNGEQREFVTTIKDTSQFMLALVSDLLDVSSIESGRLVLDRRLVDLPGLIQRNLAQNRLLAARKAITIEFDPPPTMPTVSLDVGKIEQVLNNLLSNALKFSHRDTGVTVGLTVVEGLATVTIRDQGPGIPAADLPKLFKFFGKGSVRSTAGEQSTGLGLAIVRRIIEGHGGRVWVESEVGAGTTVLFTLPLANALLTDGVHL